jgi:hypothetical protein
VEQVRHSECKSRFEATGTDLSDLLAKPAARDLRVSVGKLAVYNTRAGAVYGRLPSAIEATLSRRLPMGLE